MKVWASRKGGTECQELSPSGCTGVFGAMSLALWERPGSVSLDLW